MTEFIGKQTGLSEDELLEVAWKCANGETCRTCKLKGHTAADGCSHRILFDLIDLSGAPVGDYIGTLTQMPAYDIIVAAEHCAKEDCIYCTLLDRMYCMFDLFMDLIELILIEDEQNE